MDAPPYPVQRSPLRAALRVLGAFLPGDYLKTAFYLKCIAAPRRLLRLALTSFYRMDHVYTVLRECTRAYKGRFSILEFGTSDGYAFTKMLYATRYLHVADRVTVHTFDSFEGMPAPVDDKDRDLVARDDWVEGQFRGRYDELEAYCRQRYTNYSIHKGYFEDTLTDDVLASLDACPPILVWIDCDYYSSARVVLERLHPHLPNGCVVYFDELDQLNFGSRLTGEARLVHEINHGLFGPDTELVLDTELSLNAPRVYRFIRYGSERHYERFVSDNWATQAHHRTNDSALP